MLNSKVAIVRCENYDLENVRPAVEKGIQLLGGISIFTKPGEKILLKPNLLVGDRPTRASITHPAVLQVVAEIFKDAGATLSYGDSPALGKTHWAARQSGYKDIADTLGIPLADFITPVKLSFPDALIAKQLILAKGAVEADGIVSIPKMKTHGFTRITGAVKNQFGCVPGMLKAEYHVKMHDIYHFSKVLVDINSFLKPRLYIMDGILAMEGNGPRGGDPIYMNTLLFSTDPIALDTTFCNLISMKPEHVPTSKFGRDAQLGTYLSNEIQLVGHPFEDLANKNFKATRKPPNRNIQSPWYPHFLKNFVSPRPVITEKKCINCGKCVRQCPVNPKALNWPNNLIDKTQKPVYDYKKCIRCYCCQEICPQKAITIKTPLLGKLIY
jgi:uncharacterized protein (DUF362 family)/Pyruvate/2-oxoacid:ferredoxin oxidoreductase delta subunit